MWVRIACFIFVALSLGGQSAEAARATVGFSAALMNPACFDAVGHSEMDTKLRDHGVDVRGKVQDNHKVIIPSVLDRIKFLSNGQTHLFSGVRINIHQGGKPTGSKCASFASSKDSIELVTQCNGSDNPQSTLGHLAHELGHTAGLRSFYRIYQVPSMPVCKITHYCTNNGNKNKRNEEFAEVFATYLHSPNHLRATCPLAYEFMRKNVFPGGPDPSETCTGNPAPSPDSPLNEHHEETGSMAKGGLQDQLSSLQPFLTQIMQQFMNQPKGQAKQGAPPPMPQPVPMQPQALPERQMAPVRPWPGQNPPRQ